MQINPHNPGIRRVSLDEFLTEPHNRYLYRIVPAVDKPFTRLWSIIAKKPKMLNMHYVNGTIEEEEPLLGSTECTTTHCIAGWLLSFAREAGLGAIEDSAYHWMDLANAILAKSGTDARPDFFCENYEGRRQVYALMKEEQRSEGAS